MGMLHLERSVGGRKQKRVERKKREEKEQRRQKKEQQLADAKKNLAMKARAF